MRSKRSELVRYSTIGLSIGILSFIVLFLFIGNYKAQVPVSFLPLNTLPQGRSQENSNGIRLGNTWYNLLIEPSGGIEITTVNNEPILSNLTFCASYREHHDVFGIKEPLMRKISDSVVVLSGRINESASLTLSLYVPTKAPKLIIRTSTHYNDSIVVIREALIADYDIPVTEVYLKNRQSDTDPDYREYWLDKQGVKLGDGNRSSVIYHQSDISSLQLKTKSSLVVINLDYYPDHPFIEIPYQADGGGIWLDKSSANYKPGDERTNEFTIIFGHIPMQTPRLMLVPDGYLAAYVFTEHADAGNMRTHRAAYFGDENITDIKMASGGFAGHEIPVTKSVFFEYLDGGMPDNLTLEDDSEKVYLDFLDQLYQTGLYDLCLHTPDESNSNR